MTEAPNLIKNVAHFVVNIPLSILSFIQEYHDAILILLTALLAAATYGLFRRTASLARETRDLVGSTEIANRLADVHHQQSLSGVLVLSDLRLVIERKYQILPQPDPGSPPFMSMPPGVPWHIVFQINGELRNVGFGPTLRIRIDVDIPKITHSWSIFSSTFSVGESRHFDDPAYNLATLSAIERQDEIKDSDLDGATVTIEYFNIFEGRAFTAYRMKDGHFAEVLIEQDIKPTKYTTPG